MSDASAPLLGERLRAAREAKGLSSQKAADELHLDAWVIEALEMGDFARIGPVVYGKGHLKRYAALLGLPIPEVLDAYQARAAAPPAAASPAALAPPLRTQVGAPTREVPWGRLIAGFAIVILIVVGAGLARWQPWQVIPPSSQAQAAPLAAPATTAVNEENSEEPPSAVLAAPVAAVAPAAGAQTAVTQTAVTPTAGAVPGNGPALLRLRFSADSWVDVHDAAGRRLFAGNGRANSVKTLAGDAPLEVFLGFASGVQLEVNNHAVAIGPEFMAGDVARFEAGADGILRRDVRTAASSHPRG